MKYQKVTGWWPYVIKTPNNMYYVGFGGGVNGTEQIHQRWHPKLYEQTALYQYIKEFGWENLEKVVLIDGLTEEEARKWEDKLICMYITMGCCINKNRSGNITKDKKKYCKEYYQNHKTKLKEMRKKYYQTHKEEIREYNKKYRETHKKEKNINFTGMTVWNKDLKEVYTMSHKSYTQTTFLETP